MNAVTPSEASPRMKPETAKELADLAAKVYEELPAITVLIWVGAVVKHVVNEADAQFSIQRLRERLAKEPSS